jgi:uncharacterized protein (DUF302 family)
MSNLGMTISLDQPYEQAIASVTAALKEEGFGVLTEIDVQTTFKKKLDADFQRYIILGACNPTFAHKVLSTNLEMGLLLPCNVIVYEEGDGSVVSIGDPVLMLNLADQPELNDIATEVKARLQRVLEKL